VRAYQGVQVTFFLIDEVYESLPRALDNFQVTVSSHLSNEVNHFRSNQADFVPFWLQL